MCWRGAPVSAPRDRAELCPIASLTDVASSSSSSVGGWLVRASHPSSYQRRVLVAISVSVLGVSAALNSAVYMTDVKALFGNNDFRLYYAGAEVGLRYGWSHIYDVSLHQAAVAALQPVGPWYALLTPAPIAWLVAPLTLVGYPTAYWIWVALSLAILAAAIWYARPRHHSLTLYFIWWAALGPLWFSAYEGQVTILVAASLLAGWRLLETRHDFLGGAILALALFKPHLILLLPLALLVSGRLRALLAFSGVAAVAGLAMLLTLGLEGIQAYAAMLLASQPAGDTALTLRSALGGGVAVIAIQAGAIIAVAVVAIRARRTRNAWPLVVSALLASFLLATYWHPQDYLVLDAAAAIMLAAGPLKTGVLAAIVVTILSALAAPFASHEMTMAWLLFAIVLLGLVGFSALTRSRPPAWDRQADLPLRESRAVPG
jgi:glycosyl transferase family 87